MTLGPNTTTLCTWRPPESPRDIKDCEFENRRATVVAIRKGQWEMSNLMLRNLAKFDGRLGNNSKRDILGSEEFRQNGRKKLLKMEEILLLKFLE